MLYTQRTVNMEFPNLGKKCAWSLCKTLDFLPFTCSYCEQIFCKDHFNQDIHQCESFKRDISNYSDKKSYICTSDGCTTCSPIKMLCEKCQKHFCLLHRYHDCFDVVEDIEAKKLAWSKPKEQFDDSLKTVNETINDKIKKAIGNPKKQETALKIQLMRLKGKAEGSPGIPAADRIYFLIILPKGTTKPPKAIYISKDWSVGKVIDSVSSICHVTNKNNELKSPKLRLFRTTDGCQISTETSAKISDLITQSKINNGETLILEYVNPEEDLTKFELKDFVQYNNFL